MPAGFYALLGWAAWRVAGVLVRRRLRALRRPLVLLGVGVAGVGVATAWHARGARSERS